MISVGHFEPAQDRRTSSSPARYEQHWCLPNLFLNRSLGILSLREKRMRCETGQYPYLVSLLRVSGAIAPSPPPYFCRGSRFPFPCGACCDPSAIKQGYENATKKVCLSQHDLSLKLLKYRYPTNTDNEIRERR
jgi:hypothetical protein